MHSIRRPMNSRIRIALAFCMFSTVSPVVANIVVEPTFEEKWRQSQLVVIGTVSAIEQGGPRGAGSTATITVRTVLKGQASETIVVSTYHPIEEHNPRCCALGSTYIMFLRGPGTANRFVSVRGSFGMVRVGGPEPRSRTH